MEIVIQVSEFFFFYIYLGFFSFLLKFGDGKDTFGTLSLKTGTTTPGFAGMLVIPQLLIVHYREYPIPPPPNPPPPHPCADMCTFQTPCDN